MTTIRCYHCRSRSARELSRLFLHVGLFSVMMIVLASAAKVYGGEHMVVFARAAEVGDKLSVSTLYTMRRTGGYENWFWMQQFPSALTVETKVRLDGVLEVLATDKAGQVVQSSLSLTRLDWLDRDEELRKVDNLNGKRVVLDHEGSACRIVKCNFELSEDEKETMCLALAGVARSVSVEYYGPDKTSRNIGEEWPVTVNDHFLSTRFAVSNEFEPVQVRFKKDAITGRVVLLNRSRISGTDCLELLATTHGTDCTRMFCKTFSGDLPVQVDVSETFRFLLPVDPNSQFTRSRSVRQWSWVASPAVDPTTGRTVPPDFEHRKDLRSRFQESVTLEIFITPYDSADKPDKQSESDGAKP